jgi:hypothetical protein
MNTQPTRMTSSTAASPGATAAAARTGWFALYWKRLAPTALIAFIVLSLMSLDSVYAAPPATEQAGVIQTQETNQEGLVAEFTECRRSENVLTIKVRFRNTSTKPSHLKFTNWNAPGDNEKFYVTAGNKKYFMLKDSEGTYLSSNSASNPAELNLEPGQTFLWWAKYPAPSADVKKINFMMPVTPPFEDVPITDK